MWLLVIIVRKYKTDSYIFLNITIKNYKNETIFY